VDHALSGDGEVLAILSLGVVIIVLYLDEVIRPELLRSNRLSAALDELDGRRLAVLREERDGLLARLDLVQ